MTLLRSIQKADKKFTTSGSEPIRILASDLETYICKYPQRGSFNRMVNEVLGNRFANLWDIQVPELAFIQVAPKHIPDDMLGGNLSYLSVEKPLIGFGYLENTIDFSEKLINGMSASELKKFDKESLLKTALFDIWLSNEDRNHNNNNLLINEQASTRYPVAIDHEFIFNSSDLSRPIEAITYEDSMIYTGLYRKLYRKSEATYQLIDQVVASLHHHIQVCNEELTTIVALLPDDWGIDREVLKNRLHQNVFSESWLEEVANTFREFMSLTLNNS